MKTSVYGTNSCMLKNTLASWTESSATHFQISNSWVTVSLSAIRRHFQSIECPFTTCELKFADFIDAKFHYMTAHQSCHLFCCGMRFESYTSALSHFQEGANWENGHFLSVSLVFAYFAGYRNPWPSPLCFQACFSCHCHDKLWPTREEYIAHLQGREHKCPFPACRKLFKLNEQAITHFFSCHYVGYCS